MKSRPMKSRPIKSPHRFVPQALKSPTLSHEKPGCTAAAFSLGGMSTWRRRCTPARVAHRRVPRAAWRVSSSLHAACTMPSARATCRLSSSSAALALPRHWHWPGIGPALDRHWPGMALAWHGPGTAPALAWGAQETDHRGMYVQRQLQRTDRLQVLTH
jgi:hypothetical protein